MTLLSLLLLLSKISFSILIIVLLFSNKILCQHDDMSQDFVTDYNNKQDQVIRIYGTQPHPLRKELHLLLKNCIENDINRDACDPNNVFKLSTKISNDYASLLLFETAQDLFINIVNLLSKYISDSTSDSLTKISKRIKHILGVLSFAQGNSNEVMIYF